MNNDFRRLLNVGSVSTGMGLKWDELVSSYKIINHEYIIHWPAVHVRNLFNLLNIAFLTLFELSDEREISLKISKLPSHADLIIKHIMVVCQQALITKS